MISFDFEYYRPSSIHEAVQTFGRLVSECKDPMYYAGGTQIISLSRANRIRPGAVVDIKGIPDCNVLENQGGAQGGSQGGTIVIGAALSQNRVYESNTIPLLSKVLRRSADHTSRNRATIGGNICGKLPYRECALPFLLMDSRASVAGPNGLRCITMRELIDGASAGAAGLGPGEFLVHVATDQVYASVPHVFIKKTRASKVDYPLVSVAAAQVDGRVRVAFGGLGAVPFRSTEVEDALNSPASSPAQRVDQAMQRLPSPIIDDIVGSAAYRGFVLRNVLLDIIAELGGES